MFVTDDVPKATVIHTLGTILRIPDHFVDKITQMQDKSEAILFCGVFILEDHFPVGVLCSLVGILARHKSKAHWPRVIHGWCRNGSTDAAPIALAISEAVPVDSGRLQPAYKHPTGPVRGF